MSWHWGLMIASNMFMTFSSDEFGIRYQANLYCFVFNCTAIRLDWIGLHCTAWHYMYSIVLYCIVLNCFTCVAFILYLCLFVSETN